MFYAKNLPTWERTLRIVFGLGLAAIGLLVPAAALPMAIPFVGPLLIVSGIGAGLTGFFGFCPMCAMVGRKLDKR